MSVFGPEPPPDPPLTGVELEALKLIRDRTEPPPVSTGQTEPWCIWCYRHKTVSPFKPCPVCAGSVGDNPI